MAHDQSIGQALSIFHVQEKTKRNKDTTIHSGKWFKYGSEWFISFTFQFFFIDFY